MKPLDFVRVKEGITKKSVLLQIRSSTGLSIKEESKPVDPEQKNVGIVSEVGSDGRASVIWIGKSELYNAWWEPELLEVVDNLPNLLAKSMANPLGFNRERVDDFYPMG